MIIDYLIPNITNISRSIGAFSTAIVLSILLAKPFVRIVRNYIQPIRADGPQTHLAKKNTATFGGILIIIVFLFSIFLWCSFNKFIFIILFCGISFATIGFLDDILKLKSKSSKGLSGKLRLLLGSIISFITGILLINIYSLDFAGKIYWPFIVHSYIPISWFFLIWIIFVITGTSNAVNLTDGLDGLASLVVTIVTLAILSSFLINYNFLFKNNYTVNQNAVQEVAVLGLAFVGSLIGFLWYNRYPAKLFMGDVGALFIGGTLGSIAIILKEEIVLAFAGTILVLEALSVIIQVYYFKKMRKRFFLMAPLHHHFEKKGLKETKVVKYFCFFTIFMSLVSFILMFL